MTFREEFIRDKQQNSASLILLWNLTCFVLLFHKKKKKNTRHTSALPLVLPLMMPSRHLREKENILLFPPVDRLPFLRESVWGKAKESCLGARRPFPNTTLADMFIFWPVAREKKQALSPSWGSHHLGDIAVSACPAVSMFSSLSGELPVLSGESSPSHSRKQVLLFFY